MKYKLTELDILAKMIEPMLKEAKGITAYALAKNLRLINNELIEFNQMRQDIFTKYGKQEGDKIIVDKNSENYPKFLEEMSIFSKEEVDIEFKKLSENDLVNSGLNGEQIYLISKYFEDNDSFTA